MLLLCMAFLIIYTHVCVAVFVMFSGFVLPEKQSVNLINVVIIESTKWDNGHYFFWQQMFSMEGKLCFDKDGR